MFRLAHRSAVLRFTKTLMGQSKSSPTRCLVTCAPLMCPPIPLPKKGPLQHPHPCIDSAACHLSRRSFLASCLSDRSSAQELLPPHLLTTPVLLALPKHVCPRTGALFPLPRHSSGSLSHPPLPTSGSVQHIFSLGSAVTHQLLGRTVSYLLTPPSHHRSCCLLALMKRGAVRRRRRTLWW